MLPARRPVQDQRSRRLLVIAFVAAMAMRIAFLPLRSTDAAEFLEPWLRDADRMGAGYLRHAFTNYTAFYEHCLALMALFPGPPLLRVKLFSILFDLLLAAAVSLLVPRRARWTAVAITLLMPTIAMNSALLGQSDAIYTTFAVLALAAALRRRPVLTMLAFSAALAVKLQAVMAAPFLILLYLYRRQPLWTFLLIPVGYAAFALPMVFAGRPLGEIGGVYAQQFGYFNDLSANAPSAWAIGQLFIGYDWGVRLGLPFAMLVTGIAILALWWSQIVRTREGMLLAAAILPMLVPFAAPKMHDRYFYLVDPAMIALYCTNRRYLGPMLLAEAGSLLAYLPFIADGYIRTDPMFGRAGYLARHFDLGYQYLPILGAVAMALALQALVRRAAMLALEDRDRPPFVDIVVARFPALAPFLASRGGLATQR